MSAEHLGDLMFSPFLARVSASLRLAAHHTASALCHDTVSGPLRGWRFAGPDRRMFDLNLYN